MDVGQLKAILARMDDFLPVYSAFGEFWDQQPITVVKVREVADYDYALKKSVFFYAVVLEDHDRR